MLEEQVKKTQFSKMTKYAQKVLKRCSKYTIKMTNSKKVMTFLSCIVTFTKLKCLLKQAMGYMFVLRE